VTHDQVRLRRLSFTNAPPWLVAFAIIALDRATKMAVRESIEAGAWVPLLPGLALTHVYNTGIAFSLFSGGGWMTRMALHSVIFAAVVLIAWMLVRHSRQDPVAGLAFGFILGGAIGNLIDRVLWGSVVDFVHLWIRVSDRVWSWPDFNVADSSICVGAALLVLYELRNRRRRPAESRSASNPD
jgi:signal peptidase II